MRRLRAVLLILVAAAPIAIARESETLAPKKSNPGDILVPIPGYSPDVEANGCRARSSPTEPIPRNAQGAAITFWKLIDHVAGRHSVRLVVDEPAKVEAKFAALDPDIRRLAYLHSLVTWQGRDGLHTYFRVGAARVAPQVRQALHEAGMTREAELMAKAMALFGEPYPVADEARAKHYAPSSEPENAFDKALLAIAQDFGAADQLITEVVAAVGRSPALWARIEKTREHLGDAARLQIVLDALANRFDVYNASGSTIAWQVGTTPKPERTLAVMEIFNSEFENGGIHQFFFNSSGAIAPDLPAAMLELGLPRQAELMQQALAMFPDPYPRDREVRRQKPSGEGWTDWDEKLSAMTDAFYALDGGPSFIELNGQRALIGGPDFRQAMLAYAVKHGMLPC